MNLQRRGYILDYIYYHFKTNSLSEKWNTAEIETFLYDCGLFSKNEKRGEFTSKKPFLSISLMNVSNYDSWNSEEYDSENTNFISIVTSDNWYWGINKNSQIQEVFDGLENLLHTKIQEDW